MENDQTYSDGKEIIDATFNKCYYRFDEQSPVEVFRRVADFIGNDDESREKIFQYMISREFMFNSPAIMNAGTKNPMMSACFAFDIEDDIRGIFDSVSKAALTHKFGGGTGFNFSKIRPVGSTVASTGGEASGVISFMRVFDAATEAIKQGGTRRGANMGILNCDHPEIREFITCKKQEKIGDTRPFSNFNLSVLITDEFLDAVKNHKPWTLSHPRSDKTFTVDDANEIFDLIVEGSWTNGEPNYLFKDVANATNTTPHLGELTTTNPCWAAETKIWTKDGVKTFGEMVEAGITEIPVMTITDDGAYEWRVMRDIRQTRESAKVVKITFIDKDKESVVCTVDHNLYLHGKLHEPFGELIQAGDIQPYTWLSAIGERATHLKQIVTFPQVVTSVEVLDEEIPVYNGTVDETHRYYVVIDGNDRLPKTALLSKNCGEQWLYPNESCVDGNTLIHTNIGVRKIKDTVDDNRVKAVMSGDGEMRRFNKIVNRGKKPVYDMVLGNGLKLTATEDHQFMVDGEMKPMYQINVGDQVTFVDPFTPSVNISSIMETYGWLYASITKMTDGSGNEVENREDVTNIVCNTTDIGALKKDAFKRVTTNLALYFNVSVDRDIQIMPHGKIEITIKNPSSVENILSVGIGHSDGLPDAFYTWDFDHQVSFIRGMLMASVQVTNNDVLGVKVFVPTNSTRTASELQAFLSTIGVVSSTITYGNDNGLIIDNNHIVKFATIMDFMTYIKAHLIIPEHRALSEVVYKSVTPVDEVDVFDIVEVDETNTFSASGVAVHNCNLGSINLNAFYNGNDNSFDYERFDKTVRDVTRYMDDVIDKNKYPTPEIDEMTKRTRKIGLGVMGWADLLFSMWIPYDSQEAFDLAEKIMGMYTRVSVETSMQMAEEKGCFPAWEGSLWHTQGIKMRNAMTTTCAPTGTISIITNCSSGIEPCFGLVYERKNSVDGRKYIIVNTVFDARVKEHLRRVYGGVREDMWKKYREIMDYAYTYGSIADYPDLPQKFKDVFKVASDINWKDHLKMQAAFQRHIHNSISKTINLPHEATREDIRDAVFYARDLDLKGFTVYREGSRDIEVLSKKSTDPIPTDESAGVELVESESVGVTSKAVQGRILPKRPKYIPATIAKMRSGCGKILIPVGEMGCRPYEVPATYTNGSGGCSAMLNTVNALLGLCLRWGVPTWDIVSNLRSIKCTTAVLKYKNGEADGLSCADCIGRVIEDLCPDDISETPYPFEIVERLKKANKDPSVEDTPPTEGSKRGKPATVKTKMFSECPDCHEFAFTHSEGCGVCRACGYSPCS